MISEISDIELESITCPICSTEESGAVFYTHDYRYRVSNERFMVVRCKKCGLLYLNPRPSLKSISKFYAQDFHRPESSFLHKFIAPFLRRAHKKNVSSLMRHINSGRLLDIGCGNGYFMLDMMRRGYDVYGVDYSKDAKKYADGILKDRIYCGDIESCNFKDDYFDMIVMLQSLEHIHNLSGLFAQVRRTLKRDGILFIVVPNSDFFEARLFGPFWYNLEVPRHLYFFTKITFNKLLENNGFIIKESLGKSFFQILLTPASFYHGLNNLLSELNIPGSRIFRLLSYVPLVILRTLYMVFFIIQDQNLQVVAAKK